MNRRNHARARASSLVEGRQRGPIGTSRTELRTARSRVLRQVVLLVGVGVVAAAGAQSAAATGWSIQRAPSPAHSDSSLSGVSCTSTSNCVAVGQSFRRSTGEEIPLVEDWNGSTWSIQRTPIPLPKWTGWLSGVSCTSSNSCTAVGGGYSEVARTIVPLAERWNGSSWTIQSTPQPADARQFFSVSCVSSTACIAVGGDGIAVTAERWDGHRWRAQNVHFGDPGERPDELASVSCTPGRCAAVGWDNVGVCGGFDDDGYGPSPYGSLPVLGFWTDRGWSLQRHPNVGCSNSGGNGGNLLSGVACTSPVACTAVGTVVYRWDGHRWSIQPARIGGDDLNAVSCPSTNACTAVGYRIHTWNGLHWSNVRTPTPADALDDQFSGVSCPARGSCVVVGSYADSALKVFVLVESLGMGRDRPAWASAVSEG